MARRLKVVASADVGEMGTKQGPPVFCEWAAPSAIPQLLPWLAILALLMLKPNRRASAWWIWAPLGFLAVATTASQFVLESLPSSEFELSME
jgi:hypothetical protein